MVATKVTYEECRRKRLAENNKKLVALNLPLLSQALRESLSPKSSPAKNSKPRRVREQQAPLRRSSRVANKAAQAPKGISDQVMRSQVVISRVVIPRVVVSKRDLSHRVYASEEARTRAMERAVELLASLEPQYPSFLKSMLQSHVSGGFWLGLPVQFCKVTLPKSDAVMTLVDEEGDEYPTVYLPRKTGLSGGWKRFSVAHKLVGGDALIFQLIRPTYFKVHIVRASSFDVGNKC